MIFENIRLTKKLQAKLQASGITSKKSYKRTTSCSTLFAGLQVWCPSSDLSELLENLEIQERFVLFIVQDFQVLQVVALFKVNCADSFSLFRSANSFRVVFKLLLIGAIAAAFSTATGVHY